MREKINIYQIKVGENDFFIPENWEDLKEIGKNYKTNIYYGENFNLKRFEEIKSKIRNQTSTYKYKIFFYSSLVGSAAYLTFPYLSSIIFYLPFKMSIEGIINYYQQVSPTLDFISRITLGGSLDMFYALSRVPKAFLELHSYLSLITSTLLYLFFGYFANKNIIRKLKSLKRFLKVLENPNISSEKNERIRNIEKIKNLDEKYIAANMNNLTSVSNFLSLSENGIDDNLYLKYLENESKI